MEGEDQLAHMIDVENRPNHATLILLINYVDKREIFSSNKYESFGLSDVQLP
jgi:hypothetical protein